MTRMELIHSLFIKPWSPPGWVLIVAGLAVGLSGGAFFLKESSETASAAGLSMFIGFSFGGWIAGLIEVQILKAIFGVFNALTPPHRAIDVFTVRPLAITWWGKLYLTLVSWAAIAYALGLILAVISGISLALLRAADIHLSGYIWFGAAGLALLSLSIVTLLFWGAHSFWRLGYAEESVAYDVRYVESNIASCRYFVARPWTYVAKFAASTRSRRIAPPTKKT